MSRIVIGTNKGFVYKSQYGDFGISPDVEEVHVFSSHLTAKAQAESMKENREIKSYFLLEIVDV